MCVILEKLPGKEIPTDHLLAGSHRNPDGYGVVVHDRGKLEVVQGLADPDEAAQKVADVLAQAKDHSAYVHFRYKTVGAISVENTHPITILKKDADGVDLQFMHNGTIWGFKDEQRSDSALFAEKIVKPLAKRSVGYLGPDEVVNDPLIADILKKYAESSSKFVLFDSNGDSMVINRGQGAEQDYGWASNSYSLDEWNIPGRAKASKTVYSSKWPTTSGTAYVDRDWNNQTEHAKLVETIGEQRNNPPNTATAAPSVRLTTEEITGYKPRDFLCLDTEQVRELVEEEPDLASILILDLLYELYNVEHAATTTVITTAGA